MDTSIILAEKISKSSHNGVTVKMSQTFSQNIVQPTFIVFSFNYITEKTIAKNPAGIKRYHSFPQSNGFFVEKKKINPGITKNRQDMFFSRAGSLDYLFEKGYYYIVNHIFSMEGWQMLKIHLEKWGREES